MNLKTLKKVELHRHLEGAVKFSTFLELAKSFNLSLPFDDIEKVKDLALVRSPMRDLKSVLDKFWLTQSLLRNEDVLERITYENVEGAYNEGTRILELRYSPNFIQANHPHLSFEKILTAIQKGLTRARRDFPVATGLLGLIARVDPPVTQNRVMDFLVESAGEHIGVDLADNETGLDTKTLIPLFERARAAGLRVTIHAGEAPGTHQNVRDSIEMLGAERIGHGVQIFAFPDLIEFVKSKNVTLELCPVSNWLTNAVPSTAAHPFRKLMASGVKVCINSDDPGIFDSSLLDDYQVLAKEHGLTESEFNRCNQTAAEASFIPKEAIKRVWTPL